MKRNIDLSQYDDYDYRDPKTIPSFLRSILVHPKFTLVFRILSGVSPEPYSIPVLAELVHEIHPYYDKLTDQGLLNECVYVSNIMKRILHEKKTERNTTNLSSS